MSATRPLPWLNFWCALFSFLLSYPLGESAHLSAWLPFGLVALAVGIWVGWVNRGQSEWRAPAMRVSHCIVCLFLGLGLLVPLQADLELQQQLPASISLTVLEGGKFEPMRGPVSITGQLMHVYGIHRPALTLRRERGYIYPLVSDRHPLYGQLKKGHTICNNDLRHFFPIWVFTSSLSGKPEFAIESGPLLVQPEMEIRRNGECAVRPLGDLFRRASSCFILAWTLIGWGLAFLLLIGLRRLSSRIGPSTPERTCDLSLPIIGSDR